MKLSHLALIVVAALSLGACSKQDNSENSLNDALDNRPAEKLRDAAEDAGDAVEEAAEDVKDATKEAASDLQDSAQEAGEKMERKAEEMRE